MKAAVLLIALFITLNVTDSVRVNLNANTKSALDQPCRRGIVRDTSENHNCSMWAAISSDFEDDMIYNQLIASPNALKKLGRIRNIDGWGFAYYPELGDTVIIERGAVRAFNDAGFDTVVVQINSSEPKIILAHIRNCSAGCCCHGCDSIPDPHPFWRTKNNKSWSFEHNGTINKSLLFNLIGDEYLENNPPTGSGIPECNPADPYMIVDSELYFILILKHIEENDWNTTNGIISALREILKKSSSSAMNFVLSDGCNIWSFRKARSLYFLYDPIGNYSAVATMYPSGLQADWQEVNDYELLICSVDEAPVLIPPAFIAGDVNGDGKIIGNDVTFGLHFIRNYGSPPPDSCFNFAAGTWLYSAADANGDCEFSGSDITYLIQYLLNNNPSPRWCSQTPPVGM